jgi:glutathione S-transferase
VIHLYGNPLSTCTRKVLTVLSETGTPYEMHTVDMGRGEHKQEAHLARQPFGQIPAIEDAGFRLYESRAIARYLDAKAGYKLTPDDLQKRALMDQWLSIEQSNFSPNAMKFIYHYVFKRPQEESVLSAAQQMVDKTYAVLAQSLTNGGFVAGDKFTLADIGFMPYVEYMQHTPAGELIPKHPAVAAWWKQVSSRPSWQKVTGKA